MARTNNKYTSINFNHIYDKNISSSSTTNNNTSPSSSSSSSLYSTIASPHSFNNPSSLYKNHLPSTRAHGRMLVLTRPTPKPISTPIPAAAPVSVSPLPQNPLTKPDQTPSEPESDQISLRPLGRTGGGSLVSAPVVGEVGAVPGGSPKPNKFVPPHLRPGFVGREERPGPEVFRGKEGQRQQPQQQQPGGYFGSPGRYGEDGPPKSGGYERMRRGGESDLGFMNRPGSSGSRPNSSGW